MLVRLMLNVLYKVCRHCYFSHLGLPWKWHRPSNLLKLWPLVHTCARALGFGNDKDLLNGWLCRSLNILYSMILLIEKLGHWTNMVFPLPLLKQCTLSLFIQEHTLFSTKKLWISKTKMVQIPRLKRRSDVNWILTLEIFNTFN